MGRRAYIDWLRGVAVVVMIEAHVIDSWTREPDRHSPAFAWALTIGGFGAPLFLFLAGMALALSAGSRLRGTGDRSEAARAAMRRGLEVFGLAFLFRIQAWLLGWGPWSTLLKVDILNIMGLSMAAAAALWGAGRTARSRTVILAASTLALVFATPLVGGWDALGAWPDPLEAYIRPVGGLSGFWLFPWAGFVFTGAMLGSVLDEARDAASERQVHLTAGPAGAALAAASFGLSYLPSPYPSSYFWTTSPAFFFFRTGLMTAALSLAYAWRQGRPTWSPLAQLGRTSLFIYWIHVELVYGLISRPWHHGLTAGQAWVAYVPFCLFMLGCSMARDRLFRRTR